MRRLNLNQLAIASGGDVITETSQRNKEFYLRKLKEFSSNDPEYHCRDPKGAALCALIGQSIESRNYIMYYTHINRAEERLPIGKYDIICTLDHLRLPHFGFLRDNDGSDAMERSTKNGNRLFDL